MDGEISMSFFRLICGAPGQRSTDRGWSFILPVCSFDGSFSIIFSPIRQFPMDNFFSNFKISLLWSYQLVKITYCRIISCLAQLTRIQVGCNWKSTFNSHSPCWQWTTKISRSFESSNLDICSFKCWDRVISDVSRCLFSQNLIIINRSEMKRNRNVKLHSISTSTTITSTINPFSFLLSTLIIDKLKSHYAAQKARIFPPNRLNWFDVLSVEAWP